MENPKYNPQKCFYGYIPVVPTYMSNNMELRVTLKMVSLKCLRWMQSGHF